MPRPTQQQLDEYISQLYEIYALGVGTVTVAGRTTSYRSSMEILHAIQRFESMRDSGDPTPKTRMVTAVSKG